MKRTPEEEAQRRRLEELYVRAQMPVMLSIERHVCGCDYGSNSWTTRVEAQQMAALLGLQPGLRLLEVGAGAGWPGLYMAKISGCDVVLVDLPLAGLRIAVQRAGKERVPGRCWTVVADAAMLPFAADSFDAVTHSDLLCCLRQKRAVLESCRGAIRNHGTMVFTVISIAPDLSPGEYRRALANGPEFVEADADYQTLLAQAGWATVDRRDITLDYADSHRRQLEADASGKDALETLLGASEVAERRSQWQSNLDALRDGLLRRELFVATPRRASA